MKSRYIFPAAHALSRVIAVLAFTGAFGAHILAQTTPGGTTIQNSASATYSDGSGNNFSTISNTVTVTVANVSGLVITPDAGTAPSPVVGGQTNARFTFRVTNSGNFSDQVRFLAGGQSIQLTGPATIAAAYIDINGNGSFEAGTDIDIYTNAADALSPSLAANGFVDVIVSTNVNAGATNGQTVSVRLGDAANDNQTADNSAGEVRTVSGGTANGQSEAVGDISAAIENDAQLRVSLVAPAGPVALNSNISYAMEVCNTGARDAQSITLTNGPAGQNSGVFIIAPIPVGTALASGQTFPAGTLYSTSPLAMSPITQAVWTSTAPASLADVRRVAFSVGAPLAVGACSLSISMTVTVTTNDATTPIFEIVDAFANNSIGAGITDQSGDTVSNAGDGNADFNEGAQPGNVDGNGIQQLTILQQLGAVLLGPAGQPTATGPTSINDDYTNRSLTTGIAGVPPGQVTTAGGAVTFTNTLENTGNAADIFRVTVPNSPAGFTVEVSLDGGITFTPLLGSGSFISVPIAFGATLDLQVRVTAPAGQTVLQGYDTVIRATSILTPGSFNETIDRLYTGFLRMDKAAVVTNGTGVGGANAPVPGAEIEYVITYSNVSSAGGSGNSMLTINNLVITEDGNAVPNNWGSTTDQVAGSASDSRGGTITGDAAGSTALTDTVSSIAPGQSGVLRFKRRIR
ncbi:MAG: hypothetical protein H0T45_13705 [Pyrinomonadaceae bacterium]|nr:hypothetical protein [Pyrinomonadaceae bacterium]